MYLLNKCKYNLNPHNQQWWFLRATKLPGITINSPRSNLNQFRGKVSMNQSQRSSMCRVHSQSKKEQLRYSRLKLSINQHSRLPRLSLNLHLTPCSLPNRNFRVNQLWSKQEKMSWLLSSSIARSRTTWIDNSQSHYQKKKNHNR